MKKIIALLLMVSFLIPNSFLTFNAQANEDYNKEYYTHLINLEVLDESLEFNSQLVISRAEFAKMILKLKRIPADETLRLTFSDVDIKDENYKYIATCVSNGIMNGYAKGEFKPKNPITNMEAIKALVSLLNYDIRASYMGGYPLGYYAVAKEIGLLKNVSITNNNEDLIYKHFIALAYNVLLNYENILTTVFDEQFSYERDTITFCERYFKLSNLKGKVLGDKFTSLTEQHGFLENQILINNAIYKLDKYIPDLVGKEVEIFYDKENNIIKSIVPIVKNKELVINFMNFENCDAETLFYSIDDKTMKVNLSDELKYVFNNKFVLDYDFNQISNLKCGKIRFLDSNSDNNYELVFITAYDNYVVSEVYSDKSIRDKIDINRKLDLSGDIKETIFYDHNTNIISFDNVNVGDSLSVIENDNYLFVYVNSNSLNGTLNSFSEKLIYISEEEYRLSKLVDLKGVNLKPGMDVKIYFDVFNRVCFVEKTGNSSYETGYLLSYVLSPNNLNPSKIKVFLKNNEFVIYEIAEKYKVNETFYNKKVIPEELKVLGTNTIKKQPIIFRMNESNQIKEIMTPKDTLSETEDGFFKSGKIDGTTYSPVHKSFGGRIMVNDNTLVMQVPKDEAQMDEEKFTIVPVNKLPNVWYFVESYNFSKNNSFSDIVIVKGETSLINYDTGVAVCTDIFSSVNDDGESGYSIKYMLNNIPNEIFTVGGKYPQAISMSRGDIFRFSSDKNRGMTDFTKLYDIKTNKWLSGTNPTDSNFYGSFRMAFGYVARVKDNVLRLSYDKIFTTDSSVFSLEAHKMNTYKITVIEKKEGRVFVRAGEISDANIHDVVIATTRSGEGRNMFIIKDI